MDSGVDGTLTGEWDERAYISVQLATIAEQLHEQRAHVLLVQLLGFARRQQHIVGNWRRLHCDFKFVRFLRAQRAWRVRQLTAMQVCARAIQNLQGVAMAAARLVYGCGTPVLPAPLPGPLPIFLFVLSPCHRASVFPYLFFCARERMKLGGCWLLPPGRAEQG